MGTNQEARSPKRLRKASPKRSKSPGIDKIREEALKLALDAREGDPDVVKIYWFPHDREVHLILVHQNTVVNPTNRVEPFYFDATARVPVPSGLAIIRPNEFGKLRMPKGWGDWKDALELEIGTSA
jgi:hypothetical protein